jgi:hypothetical protein
MKQVFFLTMAGCLVAVVASWALYMLGRAIWQLVSDWRLGRELDELQAQSESRRQQRVQAQAQRLDNGCPHDFETLAVGLPPNVCGRCGLERDRPVGQCDHVWRAQPGPVPCSQCERCGKKYHPLQPPADLPRR